MKAKKFEQQLDEDADLTALLDLSKTRRVLHDQASSNDGLLANISSKEIDARIDLFELRGAGDLFREVQLAAAEYDRQPTSRLLLFMLFSLNHLREWIAGASREALEPRRKNGTLLPNEELYYELWAMNEFRVINSLCNRSKHHDISGGVQTSITQGMTCNSPCSDSLEQIYYRIDGRDSRGIFFPVVRKYVEWFNHNGCQQSRG